MLLAFIACAARDSQLPDTVATSADTGDSGDSGDSGDEPAERPVTVSFTGWIATIAASPLGLGDADRESEVSGSFTYNAARADDSATGADRGEYAHAGDGAFELRIGGHVVSGSDSPVVTVIPGSAACFYFEDGPRFPDYEWPHMWLDGAEDEVLNVWIALCDGIELLDDRLPGEFPGYDPEESAHTFSVEDAGGTALLQLYTVGG
ncbi:MAG: hypothetical protein FJ102_16475 [Deltaproteobacteria bacterium]|nr:hypothetical protein [Deltaproteobacteria bacterium]